MNPSSATLTQQNEDTKVRAFTTSGIRFVATMGLLEVLSFFGEGVGGALYILGVITGQRLIVALGILFVASAIAELLIHLGPRTFIAWRALARLKTSWVSRGTLFMSIFMAFSICAFGAAYIDALTSLQKPLTEVAMIFAALVVIYAGMMLRSMKAVTLWHSFYIPTAFSSHSFATAATIVWVYAQWMDITGVDWLRPLGIGCLLLCAAVSVMHLMQAKRTAGVQASMGRLFSGDLRGKLIWGAGFMGIIIPLAGFMTPLVIQNIGPDKDVVNMILTIAAICRLLGDYAYRTSVVVAGAYEPIVPPPSRRY